MPANKIAPWQNKRLHALLGQLGIQPDEKAALVEAFSATGATSSKELLYAEAGQLITHLESKGGTTGTEQEKESAQRMKNKMLSLAHELRWELKGGAVDMARLNTWCITHGAEKQRLDKYPVKKLSALVSQLRIVRDNFIDALARANQSL